VVSVRLAAQCRCVPVSNEYEGTSHFAVTASSAKIGLFIQSKPFEGEVP
jgi:hypothetical protein